MIQCPKCQHDNDLGRIFCAKCGEKLDITHVGPPSGVKRRTREGKKALPAAKALSLAVSRVVKVVFLAAFAAIVTLIWLPSSLERKEMTVKNLDAFKTKRAQLEEALNSKQEAQITFDEGDLNATMAEAVERLRKEAGETKGFQLNGVYFSLRDGLVVVTAEQKWKWFRLTTQIEAKPVNNGDKWEFTPTAARIGRFLAAPYFKGKGSDSSVLEKFSGAFQKVLAGADAEKQLLGNVKTITVKPGQIILTTGKGS